MNFDELYEKYKKQDSFMGPQITNKIGWWIIESDFGEHTFPDDERLASTQMPDGRWWANHIEGYGARLSAPGYMDCTEWAVFDTVQEAIDYLEELYLDYDEED